MPLREIRSRYTKSEIALLGWRSQEQYWNIKKRFPKKDGDAGHEQMRETVEKRKDYGSDVVIPKDLPDRFFNEEGEVDLRQVTGEEARKYFSMLGMQLPVINTNRTLPAR